jgi:hypothetical protein
MSIALPAPTPNSTIPDHFSDPASSGIEVAFRERLFFGVRYCAKEDQIFFPQVAHW